jgi:hypothetical protein
MCKGPEAEGLLTLLEKLKASVARGEIMRGREADENRNQKCPGYASVIQQLEGNLGSGYYLQSTMYCSLWVFWRCELIEGEGKCFRGAGWT